MDLNRRPVVALLILSLLVHVGVLTVTRLRTGRIEGYALRSLDSREYYRLARNLAERGSFSQDDPGTGALLNPDTWRTPGYPLFLALAMILVSPSVGGLVVAQQALSVLNVWLAFRIAGRLMDERRAAVAALLFLFEPYHLFYSLWLLAATWFTTLLLLTWHCWNKVIQERDLRGSRYVAVVVLGALCGGLVLVRPVGLFIPAVVLAGLVVHGISYDGPALPLPRSVLRAAGPASIFAATCSLIIGSWMLRNQMVAGHFALSDQSGVVLAYFKATEVALWAEGRTAERYLETSLDPANADLPHRVWEDIDGELRSRLAGLSDQQRAALNWRNLAQGNRTRVDSFEISRALTRIGWSRLARSPLATAECYLIRCGSILTFPLNLALEPPKGVETNRRRSAVMGVVYSLLVLAIVYRLGRRAIGFRAAYFPVACTLALLLATTPQVDPRFRVPMMPLLIIVALLPMRRLERGVAGRS